MELAFAIVLMTSVKAVPPLDLCHLEAFLVGTEHWFRKRYRPLYHLSAPYGWFNDPAAFVFYKRQYHLFYQCHPYDGSWGPMRWEHAATADLVHWAHYPPALLPRDAYDRQGCLAGSAVRHNGLLLFYTGRARSGNDTVHTHSLAVSADAVLFRKYMFNPLVRAAPTIADGARNPKVWRHRNVWYMLVGASRERSGQLLLYTSPDLYSWQYNGTVARSVGDMGYAWESPDLFELEGLCVLLLSAQGVREDGDRFRNLMQTGYVLGNYDCLSVRLGDLEVSTATFEELDRGHDFYAAKTMRAVDGRRLLVAWLGMWNGQFAEARNGWVGCMTLVRELRLGRHGRLLQAPVREMAGLRSKLIENAWYSPGESFPAGAKGFELLVNATSAEQDVGLALQWDGGDYVISYRAARGVLSVDRGGVDGVRRADWAPAGHLRLRIFVDRSSVEVFCGAGEVVFSSRIYPRGKVLVRIAGQSQLHFTQYGLEPSIGYDQKVTEYIKKDILNMTK
ncbi:putative beta-fructofuranosidase [Operophtera brumata]|uniref:Sucrose-6-phosphate hydrolase n=1 Tax=Operophtera brumata TaxID=104452 RepID=A0A0L7L2L9_OPEBR|nr:putative beta-fructofuranosidase [Operophtera brumata]